MHAVSGTNRFFVQQKDGPYRQQKCKKSLLQEITPFEGLSNDCCNGNAGKGKACVKHA